MEETRYPGTTGQKWHQSQERTLGKPSGGRGSVRRQKWHQPLGRILRKPGGGALPGGRNGTNLRNRSEKKRLRLPMAENSQVTARNEILNLFGMRESDSSPSPPHPHRPLLPPLPPFRVSRGAYIFPRV